MGSIADAFYFSLIHENRWLFLLNGLGMTMLLTFASFILGTLLGAGFSVIMKCRFKWLRIITKVISQFFIQLPTLVLLMLFVYVLFVDIPVSVTLIAIFGLTLKTGAYMSYIFTSAIDSVQPGEAEIARALGMSAPQAFLNVTFPQALRFAVPLYRNQFIQTLQETAVVGYIAIEDLTRASDVIASRTLNPLISLIIISIIYLLTGTIVSKILDLLTRERHIGEAAI